MDLDRFARVRLAHLPTPLEPLERLSRLLGGPRLWIKRDDCTGLAFGGNKTRKLEFLLAEALEQGTDTVITTGGVQSNHARQTAAAAARLGLAAELVLVRNVPGRTSDYEQTGNAQLDRLLGARVTIHPGGSDRNAAMTARAEALRAQGARPYVVPLGGSNATGALGYALCARELAEQTSARGVGAYAVVLASSSGGTQAGLVAGFAALGRPAQIIGIDVDGAAEAVAASVRAIATAAAGRLGGLEPLPARAVEVVGGHAGPGYGVPTEAMREAVDLVARLEGVLLDPVYTGKAMAGLIALVRSGRFAASDDVVFLHSGGAPALFAYRSDLGAPRPA